MTDALISRDVFVKPHKINNSNFIIMVVVSEPRKKRARKGFRYQLEFNFASEDAKEGFLSKMEKARRFLASRGPQPLDNRLLDIVEETTPPTSQAERANTEDTHTHVLPILEQSGLYLLPEFHVRMILSCESTGPSLFRIIHR